ncbi:unnamed protein product, partial [Ascophyllum nodosum]
SHFPSATSNPFRSIRMCRPRARPLAPPQPAGMPTPAHATIEGRPKTAPIMVRPISTLQQTTLNSGRASSALAPGAAPLQSRRRAYSRAPSNEFCPRGCSNCGLSFVPRGFGGDFCSGECRHSFAITWHSEKRKQQLLKQQQKQLQQQQQEEERERQHHLLKKGGEDRTKIFYRG